MSRSVRSNFRGLQALLALPEDQNRAVLWTSLTRLGMEVSADEVAEADVVFFDADQEPPVQMQDCPHVAIVGLEAPSWLARVARMRAEAFLLKPLRSAGVFTALVIGFHEHALRRREATRRQLLERRVDARRLVVKAILKIMQETGVDDDAAYRDLREMSMRLRMPLEELARQMLESEEVVIPANVGAGRTSST